MPDTLEFQAAQFSHSNIRHSRAGGNPECRGEVTFFLPRFHKGKVWIPACAGMTGRGGVIGWGMSGMDARPTDWICGENGIRRILTAEAV